jgi:hypothetical protein
MSSDATALANPKQRSAPSKRASKWLIFWIVIGSLSILLIAFAVVMIAGSTNGREFDVNTFTFRRFSFLSNPITGGQITGIAREGDFAVSGAIVSHIKPGPLTPGTRWDLVEMNKGLSSCRGQAYVLLDYISALDQQGNYYWDKWSTDHPKAAPILWSAVRDCVQLPRYDRLPEIFEAARTEFDPTKLDAALDKIMIAIAVDEAQLQATLGNEPGKQRAELLKAAYAK